ncbi:MAG: FAD-linked oxidase C-terminal domain-containing protein [Bryobacteraceae bacterium]
MLSGVVFFSSDRLALAAVEAWRTIEGLRMVEYFDEGSLRLLRTRYSDIPSASVAALLIEQEVQTAHDTDDWLDRLETAAALVEESWFGSSAADRERFRRFRHALPEVVNDTVRRRGLMKMSTDFAVPLVHSSEMMDYYRDRLNSSFSGKYVIFGHIGDAHVHVNILPESTLDSDDARTLIDEMAVKAVSLGGTVAAEHGLGKRKTHLLAVQYAPEQIASMWAVKRRLDPNEILGPGTLLPASNSTE